MLVVGSPWVDAGGDADAFVSRGLWQSRFALWADAVRMAPALPRARRGLQRLRDLVYAVPDHERYEWYGEAHNEYLQALLDLGMVGAAIVAALLVRVARSAARAAAAAPVDAGIPGRAPRLLRPQRGRFQLADPRQRGDVRRPRRPRDAPGRRGSPPRPWTARDPLP